MLCAPLSCAHTRCNVLYCPLCMLPTAARAHCRILCLHAKQQHTATHSSRAGTQPSPLTTLLTPLCSLLALHASRAPHKWEQGASHSVTAGATRMCTYHSTQQARSCWVLHAAQACMATTAASCAVTTVVYTPAQQSTHSYAQAQHQQKLHTRRVSRIARPTACSLCSCRAVNDRSSKHNQPAHPPRTKHRWDQHTLMVLYPPLQYPPLRWPHNQHLHQHLPARLQGFCSHKAACEPGAAA